MRRRLPFALQHDRLRRHPVVHQVVPPHHPFGKHRVPTGAPRRQNPPRQPLLKQIQTMVQPRPQYRRGFAPILGRAHDHNHVRRRRLIHYRLLMNFERDSAQPAQEADHGQGERQTNRSFHVLVRYP